VSDADEAMTLSRYGRGLCPVCDRSISLTKAGKLRSHGRERDTGDRFSYCAGREPKADR